MAPDEYERFVAEIVRSLSFVKGASVKLNHRARGVRQPGTYEIDIFVETEFDDALRLVLIVECKNWSRPVDRPVVQKVVQTRDAIAAHKAAIASPVGFSREALEVAEANGVAMWVLSQGKRATMLSVGASYESAIADENCALGLSGPTLMNVLRIHAVRDDTTPYAFSHSYLQSKHHIESTAVADIERWFREFQVSAENRVNGSGESGVNGNSD